MAKNYFTYDITQNKTETPNQRFFLCNLLDWPIRLSPWTALWRNRRRSYGIVKATDNCWF